jgi:hypothetical protein
LTSRGIGLGTRLSSCGAFVSSLLLEGVASLPLVVAVFGVSLGGWRHVSRARTGRSRRSRKKYVVHSTACANSGIEHPGVEKGLDGGDVVVAPRQDGENRRGSHGLASNRIRPASSGRR